MQARRRSTAAIACALILAAVGRAEAHGGAFAVPAADGLRAPGGPLRATDVFARIPDEVTQVLAATPRPGDGLRILEALRAHAGSAPARVPERDPSWSSPVNGAVTGATDTYTYLRCDGTAWWSDGGARIPLGRRGAGEGDDTYVSAWSTGPDGLGYLVVPVRAPTRSWWEALQPTQNHRVYYTTLHTVEALVDHCRRTLAAKAAGRLAARRPAASAAGIVVSNVVARGKDKALAPEHPFLPWEGRVGDRRLHTLVVFGDSLSDTDATSNMLFHFVPQRSTWFAGHFTNGYTWAEYAAEALGMIACNEAWGGAGVHPAPVVDMFAWTRAMARWGMGFYLPSIGQQTQFHARFVASLMPRDPEETLFALLVGGNDFVNHGESAAQVLEGVSAAVQAMVERNGARHVVVFNLPDLSLAPVFDGPKAAIKQEVADKTAAFNAALPARLAALRARHPQTRIALFDAHAVVNDMVRDPRAYGLRDIRSPCLRTPDTGYAAPTRRKPDCDGSNHLFWDTVHPTTAAHRVIAEHFAAFVRRHFEGT